MTFTVFHNYPNECYAENLGVVDTFEEALGLIAKEFDCSFKQIKKLYERPYQVMSWHGDICIYGSLNDFIRISD